MKKGHKPDFLTIANIARALAGQILVAGYTGKGKIIYEYFFRQTVVEVANARGFAVVPEYRLTKQKAGKGSHPKIDYCLTYGNQAIAVELKIFKNGDKVPVFSKDLEKLKTFLNAEGDDKKATAYQMVLLWADKNKKDWKSDKQISRLEQKLKDHISINQRALLKDKDLNRERKAEEKTAYITQAYIDNSAAVCYFVKVDEGVMQKAQAR